VKAKIQRDQDEARNMEKARIEEARAGKAKLQIIEPSNQVQPRIQEQPSIQEEAKLQSIIEQAKKSTATLEKDPKFQARKEEALRIIEIARMESKK
jgi:hypothetical protein